MTVNSVASCPNSVPIAIDWDDEIYRNIDAEQMLRFEGLEQEVYLFDASLEISRREWDPNNLPTDIMFEISNGEFKSQYKITYTSVAEDNVTKYGYSVEKVSGPKVSFRVNQIAYGDITDYFNAEKRSPVFFFADGSMLYANNLVALRNITTPISPDELIALDWDGVDLNIESMDWPHKENSIQYHIWQSIKDEYEFIFDDDGSGEIADLIGVNQDAKHI